MKYSSDNRGVNAWPATGVFYSGELALRTCWYMVPPARPDTGFILLTVSIKANRRKQDGGTRCCVQIQGWVIRFWLILNLLLSLSIVPLSPSCSLQLYPKPIHYPPPSIHRCLVEFSLRQGPGGVFTGSVD